MLPVYIPRGSGSHSRITCIARRLERSRREALGRSGGATHGAYPIWQSLSMDGQCHLQEMRERRYCERARGCPTGMLRMMRNRAIGRPMLTSLFPQFVGDPSVVTPAMVRGYWLPLHEGTTRPFRQFVTSFNYSFGNLERWAGALRRLTVPALVIWGGRTRCWTPTNRAASLPGTSPFHPTVWLSSRTPTISCRRTADRRSRTASRRSSRPPDGAPLRGAA